MAINYNIAKHGVCFTSKVLASTGGKHIFNIEISEDRDNGVLVKKGEWKGMEYYAEGSGDPTTTGVVLEQAANGNWYVEITDPGDGILLRNTPLIAEEWTNSFQKEENFYNAAHEIVRGYELAKGDIIELSTECFNGVPVAKKTLTFASGKWVVGA